MPLVHWVHGFEDAADALESWELDHQRSLLWNSGNNNNLPKEPPCGLCVTLSPRHEQQQQQQQRAGLQRFLMELQSMNARILRNRYLHHRRMWLELRGLSIRSGRDEEGDDEGGQEDEAEVEDGDEEREESLLLQRLFGSALPSCTALEELRIVKCDLANGATIRPLSRALRASLSSSMNESDTTTETNRSLTAARAFPPLPSYSSLRNLQLNGTSLGARGLAALVEIIGSSTSPLESLSIIDCSFGAASSSACDDLLTALADNRRLRVLKLLFPEQVEGIPVRAGSVQALSASSVRYLRLRNSSSTALPALLQGLQNNCVLEELHLSTRYDVHGGSSACLSRIHHLLQRHNFSLRRVRLYDGSFLWPLGQERRSGGHKDNDALDAVIRGNARVRRAYQALRPRNFRMGDGRNPLTAAWSRALHALATKPAIVYQFLRVGNLDDLDRHVLSVCVTMGDAAAPVSAHGIADGGRQQRVQPQQDVDAPTPATALSEDDDDDNDNDDAYTTINL